MLDRNGKDRIDRALERHQRHALQVEATSKDCELHREILFPEKKFEHPLKEGQRVTAEISLEIVRNGERQGNYFITDQQEIFEIEKVAKWQKQNS